MKKFFLTSIALLTIVSKAVFGMYGIDGDDWLGFLVQSNQFRARMDQIGFVLGNSSIRGTFGFRADTGYMGNIFNAQSSAPADFNPTISAGLAYTSSIFGIGLGYNFTYIDKYFQIHTPVLILNALDNKIRLVVPFEIGITDNAEVNLTGVNRAKFTGIGFNNLEVQYSTGIDALNEIKFYASYINTAYEIGSSKYYNESLNLELRFDFLKTMIGNIGINPFVKVKYATALKGSKIGDFMMKDNYLNLSLEPSNIYDVNPYQVALTAVLALSANSDIVYLYTEPSLEYSITGYKYNTDNEHSLNHVLKWGVYTELYINPIKDLQWYFEMNINGNVTGKANAIANEDLSPVYFETTTGITWYLPSFSDIQ